MRVMSIFSPLINLVVNLGIVLLLAMSGYNGAIPIGKVMASVNYMTQVLFALGMVSNILNSAVRATASSQRVQEILLEEPAQKSPADPVMQQVEGGLRGLCGRIHWQIARWIRYGFEAGGCQPVGRPVCRAVSYADRCINILLR